MSAENLLTTLGYPGEQGWNAVLPQAGLLRCSIAPKTVGVYLMFAENRLRYVGRSDRCLQRRLLTHEKLDGFELVIWRRCPSSFSAYTVEQSWYSRLRADRGNLNKIQPAAPFGVAPVRG